MLLQLKEKIARTARAVGFLNRPIAQIKTHTIQGLKQELKTKKIAIVHDFLNQQGGAEYVVSILHEMFPDAPIYTSIYEKNKTWSALDNADIRVSWLQKLPGISKLYKKLFFMYPLVFSSLDLSDYDVVISSSSSFAKGIRIKPGQRHYCYCHTPPRFLYRVAEYINKEKIHPLFKMILPLFLTLLQRWDLFSNKNVTAFIANSKNVQDRIAKNYKRSSTVIYPPVEVSRFNLSSRSEDFFLIVSRLIGYKNIDLAIKACNLLRKNLVIIGDGPDRAYLESIAGPTVKILGRQSNTAVEDYLARCQALLFPGEEDFGITPVEAQAAGKPVIALRAGGALETIRENETGLFFEKPTVAALVSTLEKFTNLTWRPYSLRKNAYHFSKEKFKKELIGYLEKQLAADVNNKNSEQDQLSNKSLLAVWQEYHQQLNPGEGQAYGELCPVN